MNRLQAESVQRDGDTVDQLAFTYDAAGNLITYIDGRQKIYSYQYDLMNRKQLAIYPKDDSGAARTKQYTYDLANNVYQFIDRSGNTKTYTFDNRNREAHFSWSSVPANTHGDRSMSYDAGSNVVRLSAGTDTIDCAYDYRNRKTSETQHSGGINVSWAVSYTYDADSRRKTITYPSASVFTYNYTSRDQIANISDTTSAIVSYTYDKNGNRLTRALRNGTSSQYTLDPYSRPEALQHFRSSSQFARFDYTYDVVNRMTSELRDSNLGDAFTYYLDDQLQTGTSDSSETTISYDANGNRATVNSNGIVSHSYTVNDLNEYTAADSESPTYDTKGDLTSYKWFNYAYDAANRLTEAVGIGRTLYFYYDALGRQIVRYVNGQWIYSMWDGWNLIEERTQSNTLIHTYLHGAATDEMVERFGGGAATVWFHQDTRGNTTHLTDDSGIVVERYKYNLALSGEPDIYSSTGQLLGSSAVDNRFLYAGRDWHAQIYLYDYRNRFYLPELGRFLQPDPIGFAGDQRNLYRYCGNDPVNERDPFGLGATIGGTTIVNGPTDVDNIPWAVPPSGPGSQGTTGPVVVNPWDANGNGSSRNGNGSRAGGEALNWGAGQGAAVAAMVAWNDIPPPHGMARAVEMGAGADGSSGTVSIDPHLLARFAPSPTDAANLRQLANGFDRFAAGASVVVAAPVIGSFALQASPYAIAYAVTHPEGAQDFVTELLGWPDGTRNAPSSIPGYFGWGINKGLRYFGLPIGFDDPDGP